MTERFMSENMPVLALRGLVVFPEQTVHFDIGRMKSVLALEAAMQKDQILMLVPQKDIMHDDPLPKQLHAIGTVVRVKQILKGQGENIRVLVNGLHRAKVTHFGQLEPFLSGSVEPVEETLWDENLRTVALRREANSLYASYVDYIDKPSQAVQLRMMSTMDCGIMADTIAQNTSMDYQDKIKLLGQLNPVRRLEKVISLLHQELQVLQGML